MITRTDILTRLERGVRAGFLRGSAEYKPMRAAFTRETGSDGAFEQYSDMGASPWPRQATGVLGSGGTDSRTGAQVTGSMGGGSNVVVWGGAESAQLIYNLDWDVTIGIEHNAINDDRIGGLEQWARNAGQRFQQHMDYLCFQALNAGDASTYGLAYDGQNFFSNSHADPGAEYTTAQDNLYALALSLDNFETVKVAGANFKDDRGQPAGYNHRLLIVPPELERTAAQIVTNREAYDTSNREINPYAGSVRGITAPGGYLDSTAWVLIDDSQVSKPITLQVRERPQLVWWDDQEHTPAVRYYKWISRYNVGYGDWRLALMGNS